MSTANWCCETFPICNQTFSVYDNGQGKIKGWVRGISSLGLGSKVVENIIKDLKKSYYFDKIDVKLFQLAVKVFQNAVKLLENRICCEMTEDLQHPSPTST